MVVVSPVHLETAVYSKQKAILFLKNGLNILSQETKIFSCALRSFWLLRSLPGPSFCVYAATERYKSSGY